MATNLQDTAQEDLDFWEFVTCARCFLPFSLGPSGVPSVPFWLTECGHVLCNNHLKPDQSCAKCGETGIQVTPLQTQMEQPMSTWFTAVPQSLYTAAFAASFQYNQLASLARHYKRKCSQQRIVIEKTKADCAKLHSTLEELQEENRQLREYMTDPSDQRNVHRKRPMQSFHHHANSSPRREGTPVGPNRLTLPPTHQQPNLSTGHSLSDDMAQVEVDKQSRIAGLTQSGERPGSRRFSEQYSYALSSGREPQAIPSTTLAHSQYNPVRQAHGRRQHVQNQPHTSTPASTQQSTRFKHGTFRSSGLSRVVPARDSPQAYRTSAMPPPALPSSEAQPSSAAPAAQLTPSSIDYADVNYALSGQPRINTPLSGSLSTQRFVPTTPSRRQQMLAPTAIHSNGIRANTQSQGLGSTPALSSRVPSRLAASQRVPFMPSV